MSGDDLHPSEEWLGAIARGTMDTYVTNIFRIPLLTEAAAHQLATDIGEVAMLQEILSTSTFLSPSLSLSPSLPTVFSA